MNYKHKKFLLDVIIIFLTIFPYIVAAVIISNTHNKENMETEITTFLEEESTIETTTLVEETITDSTLCSSEPITEIITTENIVDESIVEELSTQSQKFLSAVCNYTDEELDLLARLIYNEAGSESYDTKVKVGSVVLNRLISRAFPDTLYDVIYQDNQFSVTFEKINGVVMIDRPADSESIKAAAEVLSKGSVLPKNVYFFYADYVSSGWITTLPVYGTYDHTIFAYG